MAQEGEEEQEEMSAPIPADCNDYTYTPPEQRRLLIARGSTMVLLDKAEYDALLAKQAELERANDATIMTIRHFQENGCMRCENIRLLQAP